MLSSMLLLVSLAAGGISSGDHDPTLLNCGNLETFVGVVRKLDRGECAGRWSIQSEDGTRGVVAYDLPKTQRIEGLELTACIARTEADPCIVGGTAFDIAHVATAAAGH